MEFIASHHATFRPQNRGTPDFVIDTLIYYDKVNHDHHGDEILTLPKAVRQKLKNAQTKGKFNALKSHFDCNAALNEGVIVTVGHKTKCMKGLDL